MMFDECMNEFVVEREADMNISVVHVLQFSLCVFVNVRERLGHSGARKEKEVGFLC